MWALNAPIHSCTPGIPPIYFCLFRMECRGKRGGDIGGLYIGWHYLSNTTCLKHTFIVLTTYLQCYFHKEHAKCALRSIFRGNHLSNTTCLTQVFFENGKQCSK